MAYNYEYPYFDTGNFNSDWLIKKMKELEETVIGLETFRYIGENEILDLNQQKQNSIAAFTSNFNVLNSPVSNIQRVTVTYGSETAYLQQLYDLTNFTVYARNYTTASGWNSWKQTQNAPGADIHSIPKITNGDLNDFPANSAAIVFSSTVSNTPSSNNGFILTWKSTDDGNIIQLFYEISTNSIFMRVNVGNWSSWNNIVQSKLRNYLLYKGYTSSDLNTFPVQSIYNTNTTNNNLPELNYFEVITVGEETLKQQIASIAGSSETKLYIRSYSNNSWKPWYDLINNYRVIHRIENISNADNVDMSAFYNGHITSPFDEYAYVLGIGYSNTSDTYQIITTSGNRLFTRFRNGANWSNAVEFQRVASTRSLTITSTAEDHSTDDEGRDRYMMGDNIYAETAKTMDNTYISLPGQSLLHSDEGKQSFKDAILSADLSDTDVIMTNLEMWDMDIPLDTIAEEVTALSDAITAKNPMCELTLLSIPPIDIPLWGDELLDYNMPNGSTLRQVDDRLFRLTEEHPFNYVSFEYFYDAQNANLMECLGEDFKTNKQYLRRVSSFIKNTM